MADFTIVIEGADESVPVVTHEVQGSRVPIKGEYFDFDGQRLHVHSVSFDAKVDPFVGGVVAHARVLLTPHRWRLSK